MENNTMVEIEWLIHRIEENKFNVHDRLSFFEGLDDPNVLAQHTQYILGAQDAYDLVIRMLRKLQGYDLE